MPFTPLLLALTGLLMAFAVNYLADVLPFTRRFTRPACPHCGTPYPPRDYILMRSCRHCGQRRSVRAFVVLLLGIPAALWAWYVWMVDPKLPLGLSLLLLTYLAMVLVIDLEHRAVLHETSYFGAVLGLICGTYLWSIPQGKTLLQGLVNSVLGGLLGFGIMYVFYLLGELFARWMTRRRRATLTPQGETLQDGDDPSDEVALGFGDVNLTGVLGLVLGLQAIPYAIFFAVLASGLASIVIVLVALARRKYHAFMAIPYAPFLIFGAALLLYRP